VSPDYLYNPDHNITLGATYLHLLHNKYFGKVTNPANRQSISIAAYNCGPTRMNKTLVNVYDVNNMENEELVKLIRKVAPAETRKYILNVQERMKMYRGI
jgi:membrane-bound lytic murein transglycosylase C